MSGFEVQRASQLDPVAEELCWLVEGLWADQAVGIVGGEPKSGKSFLALDLAVAVASGAPCLGRFPVAKTGRVLLYAAEDAYHVVRQRLQGIAHVVVRFCHARTQAQHRPVRSRMIRRSPWAG